MPLVLRPLLVTALAASLIAMASPAEAHHRPTSTAASPAISAGAPARSTVCGSSHSRWPRSTSTATASASPRREETAPASASPWETPAVSTTVMNSPGVVTSHTRTEAPNRRVASEWSAVGARLGFHVRLSASLEVVGSQKAPGDELTGATEGLLGCIEVGPDSPHSPARTIMGGSSRQPPAGFRTRSGNRHS